MHVVDVPVYSIDLACLKQNVSRSLGIERIGLRLSVAACREHPVPVTEWPDRVLPESSVLCLLLGANAPRSKFILFRNVEGAEHAIVDAGYGRHVGIPVLWQVTVMSVVHCRTLQPL